MQESNPKRRLYVRFAAIARALGHAHKLEILELLAQGERNVEALAAAAGITLANASQHLQQLRRAGLVVSRKEGLFVYYRMANDDVIELLRSLRRTGQRHVNAVDAIVFEYFNHRDSLEPVSRTEFLRRKGEGQITVLDVRPSDEYRAGHIPGALNIPVDRLTRHLADLPRDREIVAYCRGEFCVMAYEAVAALRNEGYNACRLEEGFPEWKAAGLPVEAAGR